MSNRAVVLGVGMHPWGKWRRTFVDMGVCAAQAAMRDAGIEWDDVQFISAAATMRNGYPGYVAGTTFAHALGWNGVETHTSYAACASGGHALSAARSRILAGDCEVALVIGADTGQKGFLTPPTPSGMDDQNWARSCLGITNTAYLALQARRRMALYGTTSADFTAVRIKNSRHGALNPRARYRRALTASEIATSTLISDPLRLFDICSTSDGAAVVVLCSDDYARSRTAKPIFLAPVVTATPLYGTEELLIPYLATDVIGRDVGPSSRRSLVEKAYRTAQMSAEDLSMAEVYDLSSAMELEWYEDLGLCRKGEAESLLHSGATSIGGQIPINLSGGLASFGEALSAQALAQVCELTLQLRGDAGPHQILGATVGLAVSQGLFGNGAAAIVYR